MTESTDYHGDDLDDDGLPLELAEADDEEGD